jgi:hypothetical protein
MTASPGLRRRSAFALGLTLVVGSATCAPRSALAAPAGPPPHGPPPEAAAPITAAEERAVIDALSDALDRHYLFADKAKVIGQALHSHLRRGDYAKLTGALAFAEALTADMAALVRDKHLAVRFEAHAAPPPVGGAAHDAPEEAAQEAAEMRYQNHGVAGVRRMRFNIGYLELAAFGRPDGFADKIAAVMRLVHDTDSLIVDLRGCHGGDTDAVTLATSYLVPAKTHLLDMSTRVPPSLDHVYAAAELAGPRYPAERPVFLLIGEETASGCEAFAFTLQAQRRATVIGAPSAGAAYFGDPVRLTDHFRAFVPVGRPIEPITHADWEGRGVAPQIAAPADQALVVAEHKVLEALVAHEPSPRRRDAMLARMAELEQAGPAAR